MKNTFGQSVSVTLFGESHGAQIGAVIDGLAPGIPVDEDYIVSRLDLRRPQGRISTARRETDKFCICSGVKDGYTTGTPICITIPNADTRSGDYEKMQRAARPGHADMTAYFKYHGFEDYRGGGHFSGRITAPLVAAGAIMTSALKAKGIVIGTHIKSCAGINDRGFSADEAGLRADIELLENMSFAVLEGSAEPSMRDAITEAANAGDSVGGVLETAVCGVPAGVGEPWFDTVEGILAHAMFSIPAIKGVQFGAGFGFADMRGSEANDPMRMSGGRVVTETNNNGGINGGITNGMPILFSCAVKPTPSISVTQKTVDIINKEDTDITVGGRHDPAVIHRARIVVDSMAALVLCDALAMRYGTDWLA